MDADFSRPEDDALYDLLAEWDERRRDGREPTPDQLCTTHPHLRARLREEIAIQKRLEAGLGIDEAAQPRPVETDGPPRIAGVAIEGELGRGAMGVVYRGRQVALGRRVAVKVVLGGAHSAPRERARLRTEAVAMARIPHPNIAAIHDSGESHGLPYLVLEYLGGGSLADRIRGEPQDPRDAARLIRTIAAAVGVAHARGVLHRDLKPRNVLFAADGTPKITDYGLAKLLDVDEGHTLSGQSPGTPHYMAPEQAGAERHAIGPRTDLYALGAVLYELLTGRPPFQAANVSDTLELIRTEEPVAPRRSQPKTPRDLETICLKCLEKEPARRYRSAEALVDDLDRFLSGAPIEARPIGPWGKFRRWTKTHPNLAGSGVAGILVLASVALGAAAVARSERRARVVVERAERHEAARVEALTYIRQLDLADRARSGNRIDRMADLLASCPPRRRGWEWRCLERMRQADPVAFSAHDRRITSVAFSPDGARLVTGSWDWTAKVWDARTGRGLLTLVGHAAKVADVAFSQDGSLVATASQDRTIKLWDATTGREVRTLRGHPGKVYGVAFSPDGSRIVGVGVPGGGVVWDVASGEEELRLDAEPSEELALVAFRSDGARIAATGDQGAVKVWDATTGRTIFGFRHPTLNFTQGVSFDASGESLAFLGDDYASVTHVAPESNRALALLEGHSDAVTDFAVHPDGGRLASCSKDKTVRIWDAKSGEELLTLEGHSQAVMGVAWSPDGNRLASVGEDGLVLIWDATPAGPEESLGYALRTLETRRVAATDVAFSPDGSKVAVSGDDGIVTICEESTGDELVTLPGRGHAILRIVFNPEGTRLVGVDANGGVCLRDVETGTEVQTFSGHNGPVYDAAFHPDRSILATSGHDQTIRIWSIEDGRPLRTLVAPDEVMSVAFSPDGSTLASSQGACVQLWKTSTGRATKVLEGHSAEVWSLAFSPDGSRIATAGMDETIRIWDVASGRQTRTFPGHDGPTSRVAFSPDGARVASAGRDRTVKIWDLDSGRAAQVCRGHRNRIRGVAFSPDGSRIASAGDDGEARLWKIVPRH